MVLAGILWMLVLWRAVRTVRSPGPFRFLHRLAGTLILALIAVLVSAGLIIAHVFYVFSGEEVIAQVRITRVAGGTFELSYQPRHGPVQQRRGVPESPLVTTLEGDQWSISGGIIKWKPWAMLLGLKSYHKPLRLSGQYSRVGDQRRHLPSVQPLVPDALDRFWEAMYRVQEHLPGVDAVYGSSAYVYAEPGARYDVAVTPTGYLIRRTK
jgi:hypothetical protein